MDAPPTDLRSLYAEPGERAKGKQIAVLDRHCRRFIELSPFVVIASADDQTRCDASPRGGDPGFVKVTGDTTLLIPDSPGNNRLDTMQNIQASGRIGLLFLIPGFDETLRVNGRARISTDPGQIALCTTERRAPKVVIEAGAVVERSVVRGPVIIGARARIVHAYVGPFTAIGNDVEIRDSEIEHSIVLEGSSVRDLGSRVVDSLMGRNVRISRAPVKPSAYRFMLGDNSEVGIPW